MSQLPAVEPRSHIAGSTETSPQGMKRKIAAWLARPTQSRLGRAAISSLAMSAASAINVLVSFISVRIALAHMGADIYGTWLTIIAWSALLGFLDLGLGSG